MIAAQSSKYIPSICQSVSQHSFTGVVKTGGQDTIERNAMHVHTSAETLEQLLSQLDFGSAVVLQGIFPDDTAKQIEGRRFRFCHIDLDVYQSSEEIARGFGRDGSMWLERCRRLRYARKRLCTVNEWRMRDDVNFTQSVFSGSRRGIPEPRYI